MKKFYTLLAAALTASAMSAAIVAPFDMQKGISDRPVHSIESLESIKGISLDSFRNPLGSKVNANPASRAGVDPTALDYSAMTVHQYIDYFYNITSADGVGKEDNLRWLQQSCESTIVDNGDGTLTVTGLGGLGITYTLNVNESGVSVSLGQVVGYYDYDGIQADCVLATVASDNSPIIGGELQFDLYSDAIQLYDYLAVAVMTESQFYGYLLIEIMPTYVIPNATLKYTVLPWEGDEGEPQDISNRVYVQFYEGDDETDPALSISNVMPWNEGVSVEFTFTQVRGIDVIAAVNMIAYESEYLPVDDVNYDPSGDWYMCACTADADPTVSEDGVYDGIVLADDTETGLTWPTANEYFGFDPTYWFLTSVNTYLLPWRFSAAQLIIDGTESGIINITNDNVNNATPVYYNIQGMPVANPQAGQLYIVKQGNKVTKVIK